jgi:hypothetical protein
VESVLIGCKEKFDMKKREDTTEVLNMGWEVETLREMRLILYPFLPTVLFFVFLLVWVLYFHGL